MTRQRKQLQHSRFKSLSLVLALTLMILSLPTQIAAESNGYSVNNLTISRSVQRSANLETKVKDRREIKTSSANYEKKMSSQLAQLVNEKLLPTGKSKDNLVRDLEANGQMKMISQIDSTGDLTQEMNVYVYLSWKPGSDFSIINMSGIHIEDVDSNSHFGTAWVSVDQLQVLSELDIVQNIELVDRPVFYTGSILSTGDSVLKADLARSLSGNSGAGVKIGIISDGVDSASTSILHGDLPANLNILSNSIGGDEGTAMLEIVHDLAPDSTLYFHDCGNNVIEFNAAIDDLINSGCSIICDDIGWFNEPFFEDGVVAQHIQQLINQNQIVYVSATGNSANSHYQGQFFNDGDDFHDFSRGTQQTQKYMYATIPAGGMIAVFLQWNELFGAASSDYDLALFDANTLNLLALSEDDQTITKNPNETIVYMNQGSFPVNVEIDVWAYDAPVPKILEINFIKKNGTVINAINTTKTDSIFGHAAVPGVIACGAANASTPTQIESFSSQGPVTTLSGVRQKPDVTGVDGVAVTGAGGFSNPFYGTSAAAPHVAAIAALVSAAYPSLTPDAVRQKILDTTDDMGTAGYDNIHGHGLVNALTAIGPAYQMTFDKNGGDTDPNPKMRTTIYNGTVSLPENNPTKAGYTFIGWNTKADGSGTSFTDSTAVTSSITVYAQWAVKSYIVIFKDWNDSALKTETVNYGSAATAPALPSRTGYMFTGWDASYVNIVSDLTVIAQYVPVPDGYYSVIFQDWDDTFLKSELVVSGGTVTAPTEPIRTGYTFTDWSAEFSNVTSNLAVVARYSANIYSVTFDSQEGSIVAPQTADYNTTISAPEAPTRTGYAFTGWYKDVGLTDDWDFATDAVTADITLYAKWAPETAEMKTAAFVTRFYQLCLNRDPDSIGLSNWVNDLLSGRQTGANVAYGFSFSDEFKNRNASNTQYVTIMYKAFFNRDPDAEGFDNWMDALNQGMSRYYVLAGFTNSPEFINLSNSFGINPGILTFTDPVDLYPDITKFVTRFYQQCLNRMPDSIGLNNWVRDLQTRKQTGANVAYGFVFSQEFQNKNLSNAEYVTIMYKAFFNREPDPAGYNNWLGILNSGGSRYGVLAGFVNSQEFKNLCQVYGINPGIL